MDDVERENPLEDLVEQGRDRGRQGRRPGMDLFLGNELKEDEEDEEGQEIGDQVLNEEIIEEPNDLGIEVGGHDVAFLNGPAEGRPDGRDGQGKQHDGPGDEHDQVFHQAIIEERPVIAGLEDQVDGRDQVREQKARGDEGPDEPENPQVGDAPGQRL